MAASSSSISSPLLSFFPNPIPPPDSHISFAPFSSTKKKPSSLIPSSVLVIHPKKTTERWKLFGFRENLVVSEANPVEDSQLLDPTIDSTDGSYIISGLLFFAFLGLSILTVGVIYIATTDFLRKRQSDKFAKEEAAKKKKGGKKGKIMRRARTGPRGFGQKVDEDKEDDDEV